MNNILEVRDLCKTYVVNKRQQHVLKNINLDIREGEFVSVMGPSGSGKSTLLYNISGMDKVTSGRVKFDGETITSFGEKMMAGLRLNKMGFIFQNINLLKNLCIMDNIIVSAYMSKTRTRDQVKKNALSLMRKTGIIELADNDITQASGGQLQRAAICRALINQPKIIFGDEPTGALNSKSTKEIMDILRGINNQGTTIMLVTHNVKVASKTDRVLYMIDGKIEGDFKLDQYDLETEGKEREVALANWLFEMGW